MRFTRILMLTSALTLALAVPVFAKDKAEGAVAGSSPSVTDTILFDAMRLCDLVASDQRAIVDALDTEGWTHEITYNTGNAPFYKEITGSRIYEGVGEADIWGFLENYPGMDIGYCSFTVPHPEASFSLDALDRQEGLIGEIEPNGAEVFGTWREIVQPPSMFVHAYQNSDTFAYQITRLNGLE